MTYKEEAEKEKKVIKERLDALVKEQTGLEELIKTEGEGLGKITEEIDALKKEAA